MEASGKSGSTFCKPKSHSFTKGTGKEQHTGPVHNMPLPHHCGRCRSPDHKQHICSASKVRQDKTVITRERGRESLESVLNRFRPAYPQRCQHTLSAIQQGMLRPDPEGPVKASRWTSAFIVYARGGTAAHIPMRHRNNKTKDMHKHTPTSVQ